MLLYHTVSLLNQVHTALVCVPPSVHLMAIKALHWLCLNVDGSSPNTKPILLLHHSTGTVPLTIILSVPQRWQPTDLFRKAHSVQDCLRLFKRKTLLNSVTLNQPNQVTVLEQRCIISLQRKATLVLGDDHK